MTKNAWRFAVQFALGAAVALCGAIISTTVLLPWLGRLVVDSGSDAVVVSGPALSGRMRLAAIGLVTALWFFVGGITAGTGLRPAGRVRLGLGVTFLVAGLLLTLWLLGVWIGPSASWHIFVLQGVGCATIWTLAGIAGGLILRDEIAPLRYSVAGFGLGGLASGACLTGALLLLAGSEGHLARVAYVAALGLVCLLPPFIAGAVLGVAAGPGPPASSAS